MRHRLYYLLPDIDSARRTRDDMLLSLIEIRHMHFMSNGTPLPADLPEASILQKTDVVRGAEAGMLVGAGLGMVLGVFLVNYFDIVSKPAVVIAATLVGLLFGGWAASMVAAALPNSRLAKFYPALEQGGLLMIIDVPARRVEQIERLLDERHPEMRFHSKEPTVPVFP